MHIDETLAMLRKKRDEFGENSIVVFHSRWATHGETSEFNVHPFYTNASGETVFVHNGVLPKEYHPDHGDPRSDTQIFADTMLHHYTVRGVPSRRQAKTLGGLIGNGNKLIFLSVRGGEPKARIVNAHMGTNAYGAWFSNDGYLPSRWSYSWWREPAPSTSSRALVLEDEEIPSRWITEAEEREYYKTLECPGCKSIGSIEVVSQVCEYCETCYDCGTDVAECLCWSSSSQHQPLWRPSEIESTNI